MSKKLQPWPMKDQSNVHQQAVEQTLHMLDAAGQTVTQFICLCPSGDAENFRRAQTEFYQSASR